MMPRQAASVVNSARMIQLRAALTAPVSGLLGSLFASAFRERMKLIVTRPKTHKPYKLSDEVNDPFLSFNVRFYVTLGGGERSVSSEHLDVPQRPSDSRDCARCVGARDCPYETL